MCTGQESDAKNCTKTETVEAKKRLFDRLALNENTSQNTRMWPLTFHDNPDDVIYFDPAFIAVDLYVTSITNVVCVQNDSDHYGISSSCIVISQHFFFNLQNEKAQSISIQVKMITVSVLKTHYILISQSVTQFAEL